MKKLTTLLMAVLISLVFTSCTLHIAYKPGPGSTQNQITLPEEATGLLSEIATLWKEWKSDQVGDLKKLFTAKEEKSTAELEASKEEKKSLLERIKTLEAMLKDGLTHDPSLGEDDTGDTATVGDDDVQADSEFSDEYDHLRGHNAVGRKGVAIIFGRNQPHFDKCNVGVHHMREGDDEGRQMFWADNLKVEEGVVQCTRGGTKYRFKFEKGVFHEGRYR